MNRYAGLAFSARLCGDLRKASKYISQARITAGDIYDSPNPDSGMHSLVPLPSSSVFFFFFCSFSSFSSKYINILIACYKVCALLMMSNYMQLVLNIPLTAHYSRLADSLRLLVCPLFVSPAPPF